MESFRSYLQQDFLSRSSKNPVYSLRAYAKNLGIYHATLSAILAGKRKITEKTVRKISPKLGIGPSDVERLMEKKPLLGGSPYQMLQQDLYNAMAEWYFDAILELGHIKKFKMDPIRIADCIGISVLEAKFALETLVRLGLLEKKNGGLQVTHRNTSNVLDPNFSTSAMRKYQRKILEKAADCIEAVPSRKRSHTSHTMAIAVNDLPRLKDSIQRFQRELNDFAQRKDANPDAVYQLQISFFPLSK